MVFSYEREMLEPAAQWLRSQGLMVKKEFPTPWGICDLVGCSLNKNRTRKRLRLRQTRPISSCLRMHLLSQIPDADEQATITLDRLHEGFGEFLDRGRIEAEVQRLIKDRFVEEPSPHAYFKRNGWMPLHKRLVAVELKLTRIDDALHQAINNLGFADESYVGLPAESANRLIKSTRMSVFRRESIGVLAITPRDCRVALHPQESNAGSREVVQGYVVERFWNAHLKGSEA